MIMMWRRGVTEITATFLLIEMIPRTRVARKTYLDLLKKVSTLAMLISSHLSVGKRPIANLAAAYFSAKWSHN